MMRLLDFTLGAVATITAVWLLAATIGPHFSWPTEQAELIALWVCLVFLAVTLAAGIRLMAVGVWG